MRIDELKFGDWACDCDRLTGIVRSTTVMGDDAYRSAHSSKRYYAD
jgi:hypothetical protein